MSNFDLNVFKIKLLNFLKEIKRAEIENIDPEMDRLMKYLVNQPAVLNVLNCIGKDFNYLQKKINLESDPKLQCRERKELIDMLIDKQLQGAFAYFEILRKFKEARREYKHYICLVSEWYYYCKTDEETKLLFFTLFLNPFIELLESYIEKDLFIKN